jgi:hypothetical protein
MDIEYFQALTALSNGLKVDPSNANLFPVCARAMVKDDLYNH